MIYSTNRVERLNRCYKRTLLMRGAMPSPASVVLSLGLCCQGENGRDVCKTTAVFSGMENQVKRQIKINITNSPPAWGTPSRRGRTKENLTHFFGHYHRILDDVANDIIAEMEQNVTAPVKKGPFHV